MTLEKRPSRRKVLLGLGAAAAATAGGVYALTRMKAPPPGTRNIPSGDTLKPSERGEMRSRPDESFLNVEKQPSVYDMGALSGTKVSGLLSLYTIGKERKINQKESIDFRYQLAQLWRAKLDRTNERNPGFYARVRDTAQKLLENYSVRQSPKMTLSQYRQQADTALQGIRKDFHVDDIRKLAAFKQLKDPQLALIQRFESGIHADGLIAYALTELMPTGGQDSIIGARVLDFLLRNAGTDFVDRIPAVYDSRVSVGPYQFTSDALYELGHRRHGASLMQSLMHMRHIPQSVAALHGAAQHKAAYLFAIYNVAFLARRLGEKRSEKLLVHFGQLPEGAVIEFVAAAHHLPANAMRAFEAFADERIKYFDKSEEERKKSKAPDTFLRHCETKGVGNYCRKTQDNIAALRLFKA